MGSSRLSHARAFVLACATFSIMSLGTCSEAAAGPAQDEAQRRQELHNAAQARFDAGDYDGALEQWIRVHDELPADPELEAYRAVLLHAIASAAALSHEASGDPEPLSRALAVYEHDLDPNRGREDGGISDPEQLRPLVERQQSLEAALAEAGGVSSEPAESDPPLEPPAPAPAPERGDRDARGRTLQLVGGVALGVGAASLGVMSWALYEGEQIDQEGASFAMSNGINSDGSAVDDLIKRGERANTLAVATGVVGGVLLAAGVTLLVFGTRDRAAAKASAKAQRATLAPALAPRFAGAVLHLRF